MELSVTRERAVSKNVSRAFGICAVVLMTALGAYVRIPLPGTPVPLTLQTFFVILGAAFLGSGRGCLAQALYVGLGIAGVPLFTNAGSGGAYLTGPTGGYLFGFFIASVLTGFCIRRVDTQGSGVFLLLAASSAVILLCGALWLAVCCRSTPQIFQVAVLPFVPGDLVKVGVASLLYMKTRERCRQLFDT